MTFFIFDQTDSKIRKTCTEFTEILITFNVYSKSFHATEIELALRQIWRGYLEFNSSTEKPKNN